MDTQEREKYSKTIEKDGMSKSICVEKVENGYIITIDKSYKDEKDGYKYECKKYISKENPLEDKKDSEDNYDTSELLSSLSSLM